MATKTNGSSNPPPPDAQEDPKPLVLLAKNAYVIGVLSPLSLVIYTYERALVPLYGSGPTNEHLNKFVIAGALLAAVNPIALPPWLNWLFISIALAFCRTSKIVGFMDRCLTALSIWTRYWGSSNSHALRSPEDST